MRRDFQLLSFAGMAGLCGLAGCTVGPDYKAPATTMPSKWVAPTTCPTTLPSNTISQPHELISWWKAFKDSQLDRLVDRAIVSNLTVQQAEARIRQARAARGIAESAYWPNVNADAAYTRGQVPNNGKQQNLYKAGFDASWELDVFGQVSRSVESADANIVASVENRRDVLVTLLGDVATNYINLRGTQERIDIARENLALQEHTADVTRRQFAGGFVSGLDVANAEAQVATTRSQIPLLETAARDYIYTLSVLLGTEPGTLVDELTPTAPIPTTPPDVPVGLPSELLRRRPDIRSAEAQLHSATALIGVATADLFPKFSLTGTAGLTGSTLSSMSNFNSRYWSVGPSATWDIFSAGRIQSNIKVQEALRDEQFLGYKQTVLQALKEVDSSLVAYAKEQERRISLADAVTANKKAVDLATRLYENGQVDFLNVLNAQRSLLVVEDAYSSSTSSVATDLVALYKALGGGWENNAYPTTAPAGK